MLRERKKQIAMDLLDPRLTVAPALLYCSYCQIALYFGRWGSIRVTLIGRRNGREIRLVRGIPRQLGTR